MTTIQNEALEKAFATLGPAKIAKLCSVKGPSAIKWRKKGCLPRTEWTGETNYAAIISGAMDGVVSRDQLLARATGSGLEIASVQSEMHASAPSVEAGVGRRDAAVESEDTQIVSRGKGVGQEAEQSFR